MLLNEEESFPRGHPARVRAPKRKLEETPLFTLQKPSKPKKARKKKPKPSQINGKSSTGDSVLEGLQVSSSLSYKKLQEGMQVLSCIRTVKETILEVELPGFVYAQVKISDISDNFTKYLSEKLKDNDEQISGLLSQVFKAGQFLPIKVKGMERKDSKTLVQASCKPTDINSNKRHDSFKKNMLVWGCIQEEHDHGYEINLGVQNLRAFLPFNKIDEGTKFVLGQPLFLTIHTCQTSPAATTIKLSAKKEHLQVKQDLDSLHDTLPGMQVQITSEKTTSSGVQGKINDKFLAYLDLMYLKKPLELSKDYSEGKLITGYILFVEPVTNITHITVRNLENALMLPLNLKEIHSAKVLTKTWQGFVVELPQKCKGFITNKRLIKSLNTKKTENLAKEISKKYALNSVHQVQIIGFNFMTSTYICEPNTLSAKLDLQVGQLVNVLIKSIKPEGLVVKYANFNGFVANTHISNGINGEIAKKKLHEGKKIKARVWCLKNLQNIQFTIKPAFVQSDHCLTSLESLKIGEKYEGMIMKVLDDGAMVVFYDNIKGWIGKKELQSSEDDFVDPKKYFVVGQVGSFYAASKNKSPIALKLEKPGLKKKKLLKQIEVGQKVEVIVQKISSDHLEVATKHGEFTGIIPGEHLTINTAISGSFLKIYQIGDELNEVICVRTTPLTFSRRDFLYSLQYKLKALSLDQLKKGHLILASVESFNEDNYQLYPIIKNFNQLVSLKSDHATVKKPHQQFLLKVVETKPELKFTASLQETFVNTREEVKANFFFKLFDESLLYEFYKKKNWSLGQYETGEKLVCKVQRLGENGGCSVVLPNGSMGLVPPNLTTKNLKVNQPCEGLVLSRNFEDNYYELSLNHGINQRINPNLYEELTIKQSTFTPLLTKSDYVIGLLPNKGKHLLVYVPTLIHTNDLVHSELLPEEKPRICILTRFKNYVLGHSLKFTKPGTMNFKQEESDEENIKYAFPEDLQEQEESSSEEEAVKYSLPGDTKLESSSEDEESIKYALPEDINVESSSEDEDIKEETIKYSLPEDSNLKGSSEDEDIEKYYLPEDTNLQRSSEGEDIEEETIKYCLPEEAEPKQILLPGVSSFFEEPTKTAEESSSDDEELEERPGKKRKPTPAERREQARQAEELLRRQEQELADSSVEPKTAEQFDRLLLGNPNSSEIWTKYMSMYISSTEMEKAKSVGQRALDTIDCAMEQEKLNIWLALLNLENLFGTQESFEELLSKAVKFNDSLTVYLKVLAMFVESNKVQELNLLVKKLIKKYRDSSVMWLEAAKSYYMLKDFKEARNLYGQAIKNQTNKTLTDLVIKFGLLEFKLGEADHASQIFETFLLHEPLKVQVWSCYVDQLVKIGQIDQARQVLDRASSLRLPMKSMKSLLLKYRRFEEQFGTADSIQAVKDKSMQYIHTLRGMGK